MKRLIALAAFLLASSAAQAQYTIDYNGKTIRIDPDRGTVSIPGVYDNTGHTKAKRTKTNQDAAHKPPPQAPAADPPAAAPAQATSGAPPAAAPARPATPPSSAAASTTAAPAPAAAVPARPMAAAPPAPEAGTPPLSPPPAQAPASATLAAAPATAPPHDPNSPIGIWLTEEKEGKIRIEACGPNLCGYAMDAKTSENREQILINMRPATDKGAKKWSGRIFDPDSGSTYDSTIAMQGPDALRVQGCAFSGMFCGGQTWTRVN